MTSRPETTAPFERSDDPLDRIRQRTGLVLDADRAADARAVLHRVRDEFGLDESGFRRALEHDRRVWNRVLDELTVGETYFFRDPAQFEFLRGRFLEGLHRTKPADHVIRIWSAGCASGEEVWSLTILFTELGLARRTRILGTDVSAGAIERARAGVYRPWSLRDGGVERAGRWVRERDGLYEVSPSLRRMVTFEVRNLAEPFDPAFAGYDLVLCRNVLIYLDPATIRGVARRLFASLAPGGWLLTAASDPPLAGHAPFVVTEGECGLLLQRPTEPRTEVWESLSIQPTTDRRCESPGPTPGPTVRTSIEPRPIEPVPSGTDESSESLDTDAESETAADIEAEVDTVRRLANEDLEVALERARAATRRFEVVAELHHLEAAILADLDRPNEAIEAVRRALFLEAELVVGHLLLGLLRERLGDVEGARRAFSAVSRLCGRLPADEIVPFSDGECAGRLAELAERRLERSATPP